jgi:hypothetical protein
MKPKAYFTVVLCFGTWNSVLLFVFRGIVHSSLFGVAFWGNGHPSISLFGVSSINDTQAKQTGQWTHSGLEFSKFFTRTAETAGRSPTRLSRYDQRRQNEIINETIID